MSYCFDFIETPISKFFVLDSPKGIHYLIKYNDFRSVYSFLKKWQCTVHTISMDTPWLKH